MYLWALGVGPKDKTLFDGRKEPVMFDKITSRIQKLCYGLNMEYIDPPYITLQVINGLYSGVTTVELDNLAAETAALMSNKHPAYAVLAARIAISNLHKETRKSFSDVMEELYQAGLRKDSNYPKMDERFYKNVTSNADALNSSIIYDRDFSYSYFGMKVLEKKYLKKIDGKVVERPQHMFMRVAVAIHCEDIAAAVETYNLMSEKWYMHSPVTLSNAGFVKGQMLSEASLIMKGDSIEGIYDTLKETGLLARTGVSTGLNVNCIRSKGSYIAGTNGNSNGLMPMLRVYSSTASATHQGGMKESSDVTIYLEPWHADVLDFLTLKKQSGKEEQRARNLRYALWIPDLFMKRVSDDADWCLMCPHDSEDLENLWGEKFEEKYLKFEKEGRYSKKVKARQIWNAIYDSQLETEGPLMIFKDNCNRKSNLQNVGTILGSSFNGELMVYTSPDEGPVCGSAFICADMFVESGRTYNFTKLKETVKVVTRTLNTMIDVNRYLAELKDASLKYRPIAIGVQGLADAFILMKLPFESEDAKRLNRQIFETIYYSAMEASCELAEKLGSYQSYKESPVSKGIFQFDMWNVSPTTLHDWAALKKKVSEHGVRNSLLVACPPSTETAEIHGCNNGIEPNISNVQTHKIFGGSLKVINEHLLKDLTEAGVWDDEMENMIKAGEGSIQGIEGIPEEIRNLYKTAWEIPQKTVLEMAIDRSAFIDQSQSINVHITDPNYGKITSMHFFAWRSGLKTGMLHLKTRNTTVKSVTSRRTQTAENGIGSEVNGANDKDERPANENMAAMVCSLENKDDCLMCGS